MIYHVPVGTTVGLVAADGAARIVRQTAGSTGRSASGRRLGDRVNHPRIPLLPPFDIHRVSAIDLSTDEAIRLRAGPRRTLRALDPVAEAIVAAGIKQRDRKSVV